MSAVRHFSVLFSVFLLRHLSEAMKCLRSCEDASISFPECGGCLQDCFFNGREYTAQKHLRALSKNLQPEYDPLNKEATWFFNESWAEAKKSNATVTMYDWDRREGKGRVVKECCGVSVGQGKCKVSLSSGNLLFWSLNENGISYGSLNAIHVSQPVATSIYFCDEKRKVNDLPVCLAIGKRQGRMRTLKYERLEATSLVVERNLERPQLCLSHYLNGGDSVPVPEISEYFLQRILEIAPTENDSKPRECLPTTLREIFARDFSVGPSCFYFARAVEPAYLYCVDPTPDVTIPGGSQKEKEDVKINFVYVAIAAASLVLFAVVILALVLRARRRANAATKGKHSDWRSQEGILVTDAADEKLKHDEAPSVI